MKTDKIQMLSPSECKEALAKFWGEQLRVEPSREGVLVALPLLYPDGLQVVLSITPVSQTQAVLSDRGETLMALGNAGVDLDLPRNAEILDERINAFEIKRQGFELQKAIRLPMDGLDVHLFGEALVSIAHLIYRHELATPRAQHVYNAVRGLLVRERFSFKEGEEAYVLGQIEQRIRVDFLVTAKRAVACKAVERRGRMREYIEQWGFRWLDAKRRNDKLIRAMFYDPDNQQWDEESLRIGQDVCEVFYPYFDTDKIDKALEPYKEAA